MSGVETEQGRIDADYVVLCGGMWTRDLAAGIGVTVPLHACEHYYVLFKDVPGLDPSLPVLRDYDHCSYFKYDAGKLLVGAFEPNARPWGTDGIPEDFSFGEIAGDFSHFEPVLLDAMRRVPALEQAGIQKFFCGPESFTPDVRYHLGESAELENCFVAAGLNSIGLQSAGGIGKVVSEWIRDGHPPIDLWEVDVRRNMPFQINRKYLQARVSESLGLLYATHWPFRQYETARGVRTLRGARPPGRGRRLLRRGLRLGARQLVCARPASSRATSTATGGRTGSSTARTSTARVRNAVGPVRSILVRQVPARRPRCRARAEPRLRERRRRGARQDGLHAVAERARRHRGGSDRDAPLRETAYLIVTRRGNRDQGFQLAAAAHRRRGAHCVLTNVTSGMGVLVRDGAARSRDLLQSLTPDDLSDRGVPVRHQPRDRAWVCAGARLAHHLRRGARLGDLRPHRIHGRACTMRSSVRARTYGLVHAGYHALNSLRIEKAYRHFGHDITDEDTPLEAGLGFAVKLDKPGGFIGREALLRQREPACAKRLVQFQLKLARAPALSQRAHLAGRGPSSATSAPACTPTPSAPPWASAT